MTAYSVEPNPAVTFKVRYRDDDLLVVDKRAGLPTQPGLGHERDTLLNGLFAIEGDRLQNLGRARDFGLLHRLDRETSGLLVVALSTRAYDALRSAFEGRQVRKFYWAVCAKAPRDASGVINLPLVETGGRDGGSRARAGDAGRAGSRRGRAEVGGPKLSRVSRAPGAKAAATAYRVLQVSPLGALIEARPLTGRLHQVRVHLDAVGATILGDDFYGPRSLAKASPRLALHAHRIAFRHPVTGADLNIRSPWPADLRALLRRLKLQRPDIAGPAEGEDTDPSPVQPGESD
jgi:23S rRNA pseudouridine1911/1915/1917 synthase